MRSTGTGTCTLGAESLGRLGTHGTGLHECAQHGEEHLDTSPAPHVSQRPRSAAGHFVVHHTVRYKLVDHPNGTRTEALGGA